MSTDRDDDRIVGALSALPPGNVWSQFHDRGVSYPHVIIAM